MRNAGVGEFLNGYRGRWVWPVAIMVIFSVAAGRLGTDVDWDLRNYHAYNARSLLNGRFWTDIAPAQLQTFLSPALDIPTGAVRDWLNDTPVILNVALSVPHSVSIWLAFSLTLRMVPTGFPGGALFALALTLFSAIGVAGYPLLATSQDNAIPVACILGGLLCLVGDTDRPFTKSACAGLLFGLAAGLKLTELPYCLAGAVALLLAPISRGRRLQSIAAFSLSGFAASAVVCGPWWLFLYCRYKNPILPFMNNWFHSPFVDSLPFTDERFKPHGLGSHLAYPFYWALRPSRVATELYVRDPRFALAYVAAIVIIVRQSACRWRGAPGLKRAGVMLVAFFTTGFVLWQLMFSVLRYLASLELLIGAMILLALQPLLTMPRPRAAVACAVIAVLAGIQAVTVYPDWGRLPFPTALRAEFPTIESNGLIVLLDPSPMAYLANVLPPSVRFVGANSNLIQPGSGGILSRQAEMAIRTYGGPRYGLEDPVNTPGAADRTLAFYGLRRGDCRQILSNLDNNAIRICRLRAAG